MEQCVCVSLMFCQVKVMEQCVCVSLMFCQVKVMEQSDLQAFAAQFFSPSLPFSLPETVVAYQTVLL